MNSKLINLLAGATMIALFVTNTVFAQIDSTTNTTTLNTTKKSSLLVQPVVYPTVDIGVMGGVSFPIADMSNNYKQGGVGGVDIGLRLNKEVGIFLNGKYLNLPNQNTDWNADKYFEITAGPRYYFINPKLKSLFFLEAGVGAYIKKTSAQNGANGTELIPASTNTNIGVNAGPGFSLWLSPSVYIILKAKYHVVFTSGYTSNFVTSTVGVDFVL